MDSFRTHAGRLTRAASSENLPLMGRPSPRLDSIRGSSYHRRTRFQSIRRLNARGPDAYGAISDVTNRVGETLW